MFGIPAQAVCKQCCRYPHHPEGFAPHRVLEYPDFISEEPAITFKFTSMDTFFSKFKSVYGGSMRFSGGAPAILNPVDPSTYIAVGHLRANRSCFHEPLLVGSTGRKHLADSDEHMHSLNSRTCRRRHTRHGHHKAEETIPGHEPLAEYMHFLFAFSAAAPHELTGINHSFKLYDAPMHGGVQYVTGLTVRGNLLYMTYGKDDYRSGYACCVACVYAAGIYYGC